MTSLKNKLPSVETSAKNQATKIRFQPFFTSDIVGFLAQRVNGNNEHSFSKTRDFQEKIENNLLLGDPFLPVPRSRFDWRQDFFEEKLNALSPPQRFIGSRF